jgi:predicted DNA-binding transcriptional regulator AlpA
MICTRKFIRRKPFADLLGVSRSQTYVLQKRDPRFPKPVRISQGLEAFVIEEAETYIQALISKRDSG